jgi:predicted ATPase
VNGIDAKHFLKQVRLVRDEVPDFAAYPFNLPAIHSLNTLVLHPQVTFLAGENGTGKSTLIEAIAIGLGMNAEGGSRNMRFATRESHSSLHRYLELRRGIARPKDSFFFRAESFFNLATEVENLQVSHAYGATALHEQSHGESFLALFQNRFFGQGLYLLDEPESALSPMRQMAFLSVLHDLIRGGSQFIIATHSPILLAYPAATIYWFDTKGIRAIPYEETEHYKVSRSFLLRRDQMLRILCEGEPPGGGASIEK